MKNNSKKVKDVIMVCVCLLNVFGSERNINKYLCYLYFFHDTILAHFDLKVKFISIP